MVLSNLDAAVVALTQRGKKHLHRLVLRHCACVPDVPSRATYGRLSPRWPVVQDDAACVLGANACFSTENDSKGDGLMRLAGHTPSLLTHLCEGPVGVQSNVRCAQAASSGRPCNQSACSVSLWVRRLWNSCHLLFVFSSHQLCEACC